VWRLSAALVPHTSSSLTFFLLNPIPREESMVTTYTTVEQLTSVVRLCRLVSQSAAPFSSTFANYMLFSPPHVVALSHSCTLILNCPWHTPSFSMPIAQADSLLSLFPPQEKVIITTDKEGERVVLSIRDSKSVFNVPPPHQFPEPEIPVASQEVKVDASRLSDAMTRCIHGAKGAARHAEAIHMYYRDQNIVCLGTDLYKAVIDAVPVTASCDLNATIPLSHIPLIAGFCKLHDSVYIKVVRDGRSLMFVNPHGVVITQLLSLSLLESLKKIAEKVIEATNSNYYTEYTLHSNFRSACNVVYSIAQRDKGMARFLCAQDYIAISAQTAENSINVRVSAKCSSFHEDTSGLLQLPLLNDVLPVLPPVVRMFAPPPQEKRSIWVFAPADQQFPVCAVSPIAEKDE